MTEEKPRYSDEELEEFRAIINEKLEVARADYKVVMDQLMHVGDNTGDDMTPTYHNLEEGSPVMTTETMMAMADRAQKFIKGLEAALVRINNKTYGICRETGKLIPKERLRLVPHATLSIEAKQMRDKRR